MNTKSMWYGNSRYATVISSNAGDVTLFPVPIRLELQQTEDDFFRVLPNGSIVITKTGFLRLTLKATLDNTVGGLVDIQVFRDTAELINARRQVASSGYFEANFQFEVNESDAIYLEARGSVTGMAFNYLEPETGLVAAPPFAVGLEFIERDFSKIGKVIEHISPNLFSSNSRYIPLDSVDGMPLPIADYPLLEAMLRGSQYVDAQFAIDNPGMFKVVSCLAYPYMRGGNIVFAESELPDLGLTVSSGATTNLTGYFGSRAMDNGTGYAIEDVNGVFSFQNAAGTSHEIIVRNDADYEQVRWIHFDGNHSHSFSPTHAPIYSGGTKIQPPAVGVYRYIIGDEQL